LRAALDAPVYRNRLSAARLSHPSRVTEVEAAIAHLAPISKEEYVAAYRNRPRTGLLGFPEQEESTSAMLVPYAKARLGLDRIPKVTSGTPDARLDDLYSSTALADFAGDLYRLSKALKQPARTDWQLDQAVVVFSGLDAGVLTGEQRDELWERYQVPLFEQFVGPDGAIVASECEIHAGMHIKVDRAVIECLDGEIVLTSLTDLTCPAIRVRTRIHGCVDTSACECGRTEPRLTHLHVNELPRRAAAVA
jgi:phenylacetate-coenzyme A ligase PaaK-like adenylate-forming protein